MGHALKVPDVGRVVGRRNEAPHQLFFLGLLGRELLGELLGTGLDYASLVEAGREHRGAAVDAGQRCRPVGWHLARDRL